LLSVNDSILGRICYVMLCYAPMKHGHTDTNTGHDTDTDTSTPIVICKKWHNSMSVSDTYTCPTPGHA
jgi:hypothetical protein